VFSKSLQDQKLTLSKRIVFYCLPARTGFSSLFLTIFLLHLFCLQSAISVVSAKEENAQTELER
jgi:hypothetical protein